MQKHEYYEELCALAAVSALSDEELTELAAHADRCPTCRESLTAFPLVLEYLPAEADELTGSQLAEAHAVEYRGRFLAKAESQGLLFSESVRKRRASVNQLGFIRYAFSVHVPLYALAAAAAVFLAAIAGFWSYARSPRVQQSAMALQTPSVGNTPISAMPLRSEFPQPQSQTVDEHKVASKQSKGSEIEPRLALLQAELNTTQSQNQQLREQLVSSHAAQSAAAAKADQINNRLSQALAELHQLQELHESDSATLVAQQVKVNELSEQLTQQRQVIEQEKQLSAAVGDVRQMMGARNLHIIDVYDVDGRGRERKSFGRIFYTEGKSLLFYAFDLAQKSKSGTERISFQVWGQREAGGTTPRNLGLLTLDDHELQRWVLRIDDPKKFAGIDSLFVTAEPHGGADRPSHQRLLYAFIGTPANHP